MADRLRGSVAASLATLPPGERRAVLAGVALGEDEGLEQGLRDSFRASGLYHLLAVSDQNVAYVVAGTILLAWTLRRAGHVASLRIGVARAGATLRAHAWLEHEGRVLLGSPEQTAYEPLAPATAVPPR